MEVSVQNSDASDIPKMSRYEDLNGIFVNKSRRKYSNHKFSKGFKRANGDAFGSGGSFTVESRRKRSRKEDPLNSFGSISKRPMNSLSAFVSVGKHEKSVSHSSVSDSLDRPGHDIALVSRKKKCSHALGGKNSESCNGLGDDVVIPKRPRGVSRQRKVEKLGTDSTVATEKTDCGGEEKAKVQVYERPTETVAPQVLTGKKKRASTIKENGSGGRSANCIKAGSHVRSKRKKVFTSVRHDSLENEAPLADTSEKFYGDEDDVGNLEENAARMLSSRFDPSCTVFLGDRTPSSSNPANGYHGNFKNSRPESSSVDAAGRSLRPRRRSGERFVGTRRHFYEVCSSDVDPYFIVKQRIRVFWPLDNSWYFGLVKDYDPVTRLHHVKYDDRDEEWIDLRSERFKLLLFPSEILGKFHNEKSQLELNQKDKDIKEGDKDAFDDSCLGEFMDSEPIISWLTRTKHHRKSSPTTIIKRQSKSHLFKDFRSSISLKQEERLSPSMTCFELEETLQEVPEVKSRTSSSERKVPFVYFRRRFHKSGGSSNKMMDPDSIIGHSVGSIGILAFVADSASVLEELNAFSNPVEVKQVTVNLKLRPFFVHDIAFGTEGFSLWHVLSPLQFGKLVQVWPIVHMEIVVVDNLLGLRLLLFEGSLGCMVGLLCSIINIVCQRHKQSKFVELQMPCTSVGFKLSGLRAQGGHLFFVLYSFLQLDSVKWRYLEDKFKQHCLTTRELSGVDCTHSKIKNSLGKDDQMFGASVYKKSVLIEDSPERSFPETIHQIISKTPLFLNMGPGFCYIDENHGRFPTHSLSFATSPSFLMSLHLRLLIEKNAASYTIQKSTSSSSQEFANNLDKLSINGSPPTEDPSDQLSDITIENSASLSNVINNHGKLDVAYLKVETDALSFSNDGDWMSSSDKVIRSDIDGAANSIGGSDLGLNESEETVVRFERSQGEVESLQNAEKPYSSYHDGFSSAEKSEEDYSPSLNNVNAQSQPFGRMEEQAGDKRKKAIHAAPDLAWELNEYGGHSINPTAPRSFWHRNRHSSTSPTFGHWSNVWSDDFMQNGFAIGSKKPRTQVSCSFPSGGHDLGLQRQGFQRKTRSYKTVKTANSNMIFGGSASAQNYHGLLTCDANVLVTTGDRGWRECGALVVLDSDDQKDWRISVKLSGVTKYEHKSQHIVQPGITNCYTHAMMWKGGKDWTLEFTDRSQWSRFKGMHEECCKRNIRVAYVKNIPIPGVRLISDADDNIVESPFVRSSSKYYRQVGTDVDMASDPSHVLYDMDSSDEKWISKVRHYFGSDESNLFELTDDMFERVMDTFEKFAYAQQCDEFSVEEIEEFMTDAGRLEIVKAIYEHWRQKRLEKGLPLIRQFQPPLWMLYEQQLKDWDLSKRRMHSSHDGLLDQACSVRKPTMFAFCLRPRGLEIANKGPKQRSNKKTLSAGCHRSFVREHDSFHAFGRRSNGFSIGGEKTTVAVASYESSDSYHSNDGSETFRYPEHHRNNSKRGMFPSLRDSPVVHFPSSKKLKRAGLDPWIGGAHEWSSTQQSRQNVIRGTRSEIDEFRLRDASSAAHHASNIAKLKREKAQWLLHKADLALHKATTALVIAESLKESEKDLIW